MIYIVILSITTLFFLFALILTPYIKKLLGIKICALCAACSLSWITLLILRSFKILDVDNILVGVLMGGSVVGIEETVEDYFESNRIKKFWFFRLLIVIVGYYTAYSVAIENFPMILIGSIATLIIVISIYMFIFKNKQKVKEGKQKADEEQENFSNEEEEAIKKLEKSLEDCC
ncbi:hypothetical protein JW766_00230 [Candidatus Dojkabacteria bacterium]|nr:hypothetical protein [Candidatus Dojkabacteria bacterium]